MEDKRYRVLLIEDDQIDQIAFKRLVRDESLSYDYMMAGSVSEAQSILSSNEFDVVIVDHFLGDGTAFDILDSLKEDTPAIFATGAGDEEIAIKAMKAGAYDYLIKDLGRNYLKVLPETIKNAVRHKNMENELKTYHDNLEAIVKQRTEQLAAEKELLSVTLSGLSDGVIAVDTEKRIMLFNKVAEELAGWKFEEVQRKPLGEVFRVIDEKTKQTVESPVDKVLDSGNIEAGVDGSALIASDGSERPISATAAPIRSNDGTVIGVVMVFRNVSHEREVDRMKTDFISSVSHELRTPLTSIKAYTDTILNDPNMSEQTRQEFLTVIDKESNRLAELIEDLLEISRIESGPVKMQCESIDITAMLGRLSVALRPLADKKNIQMQIDAPDGLPLLQGDEARIESVLTNLVDNAIKFTPEQGRVCISVHQRTRSWQ